jgi:hypothetical protein
MTTREPLNSGSSFLDVLEVKLHFRSWQILLQKSKIEQPQKSRES